MTPIAWGITIVTFALALLPGLLARTTMSRVGLMLVPVAAGGWLALSGAVFGTREQLYAGGSLVMMGTMPAMLAVWVFAAWGVGRAVTRLFGQLGSQWGTVFGSVAGVTAAIAIPLAYALSGLANA